MTGLAWTTSLPYQGLAQLRQRRRKRWPQLPRPTVSVGNLAFGGRGKTPLTAALARAALERGLQPAILSRGYRGRITSSSDPLVLRGQRGPAWLQPIAELAPKAGEEAAWLAASCPGTPVAVHPDRCRAAAAVLLEQGVDLFLLDDGFQTPVQRDLDLVLLESRLDPPFQRHRTALREGQRALQRAGVLGIFGAAAALPTDWPRTGQPALRLQRRCGGFRRVHDAQPVGAECIGAVVLAAGVGQVASVERVLAEAGVEVAERLSLRDHGQPSRAALRTASRTGLPLLVTEKDAVGWARHAAPEALVLELEIDGADALCSAVLDALPPQPARSVALARETG